VRRAQITSPQTAQLGQNVVANELVHSVTIDGLATGYTSTLNGGAVCPFRVKNGGSITVAYATGTPLWVWIPD